MLLLKNCLNEAVDLSHINFIVLAMMIKDFDHQNTSNVKIIISKLTAVEMSSAMVIA
mgnify:CR=1 FL=1